MSPPMLFAESGFLAVILAGFVMPVTCILGALAYRFYAARSHGLILIRPEAIHGPIP